MSNTFGLSWRTGIVTLRHCVPGKNMLPSCDMRGAEMGIFTTSTDDAELTGVMLTCRDQVNTENDAW
jgi:hypothetical protein